MCHNHDPHVPLMLHNLKFEELSLHACPSAPLDEAELPQSAAQHLRALPGLADASSDWRQEVLLGISLDEGLSSVE